VSLLAAQGCRVVGWGGVCLGDGGDRLYENNGEGSAMGTGGVGGGGGGVGGWVLLGGACGWAYRTFGWGFGVLPGAGVGYVVVRVAGGQVVRGLWQRWSGGGVVAHRLTCGGPWAVLKGWHCCRVAQVWRSEGAA